MYRCLSHIHDCEILRVRSRSICFQDCDVETVLDDHGRVVEEHHWLIEVQDYIAVPRDRMDRRFDINRLNALALCRNHVESDVKQISCNDLESALCC